MKGEWVRRILISLAAAAAITTAAVSGLFYSWDSALADKLYQSPRALSGDIVIIGIDERALEDIGPYQMWGRDVMAMAVDYLNEDPDFRPAAIGLDILFAGETEPGADAWLAEACGRFGNVVVSSAGTFGTALVSDDGGDSFRMDNFALLNFEEPYDALKDAICQGHINGMYDRDGRMRHSLLCIGPWEGEMIPSFNYMLYRLFAEQNGLDGDAVPPTDARNFWYLPYSGKPGAYYDGVSVVDLITGEVPRDYFADKIVLIGPYAAGLGDQVITAIDAAAFMYGVEFQANAIEGLIRGEFKQEVTGPLYGLLVFWSSLAALLFYRQRKVLPATVFWLLLAGGWVLTCKAAYHQGYVLPVLWIPLAATLLYVACVAANYTRAAIGKKRVTDTFKRYVAPGIVNEILKEGSESLGLGGKMTDIAVLFVDIRGFTPMSEVLSPPQVVAILNCYLELTSSCIMKYDGTLDKFIGDATMAIWGAPIHQEDYIYQAVKAALDMVAGSQALGQELSERYGRKVEFGIGIHCGPAVVGNIGAPMRMDYTAIGDTVNTAARLEANAPAGKIYISRAVADALDGRIKAKSLGDAIKLKGKAEGFEVLELKGLAATTRGSKGDGQGGTDEEKN